MKLFKVITFLFLVTPSCLSAQQHHFIYLQTEGKQPFYAKLDKKTMSSSASGYLIIPKLHDGEYNIVIGFPRSEKEEQIYTCKVNDKDQGYLIKNFGDKGWGLFNLQTMDVVMAGSKAIKADVTKTEKTDDFSSMLSDVVNDPSIKQSDKASTKQKEEKIVSVKETPAVIKEEKQVVKPVYKSTIVKYRTSATQNTVEATYIDITGNMQDTVQVIIPIYKDETFSVPVEKSNAISELKPVEEVVVKKESKVLDAEREEKTNSGDNDKKFLSIDMKASTVEEQTQEKPSSIQMVNSDCKTIAADEDFLKFRKKMAAEDTDDAMLEVAKKFFKTKCYTTEQVKNLSVLFLKDAGKYKFFDMAFQFVSDTSNFSSLQSQLSDSYYITRFKAMVTH